MTSARAATVWRSVHYSLLLAVLVAGASGATPRHRLRSSSPTKIDFWSVYEDAINKFGHVGSSSPGSGQGAPGVEDQERSKAHEPNKETSNDSKNSLHQSQYMYLGLNPKGHLIQPHPEDDEFKKRLVELKVKHIQDLLGHTQASRTQLKTKPNNLENRTQLITKPNNLEKDSTSVVGESLEQRPLGIIESPQTDLVMSEGSLPLFSENVRDAVQSAEKKVVKRRRKPLSGSGETLTRYPTPRLTVTDDDVTTNANDSSPTSTPVEDRQKRTSTRNKGTTDEGTVGEGTPGEGITDMSTTDEGTTNDGTTDDTDKDSTNEDTTDEGATYEGTTEEGISDEGTTDEGTTEEVAADESTTDSTSDSSASVVFGTSSDDFTNGRGSYVNADNSTDNTNKDSTTSNNNTYNGVDGSTTTASSKNNSNDLKKSDQTTDSKDSIDRKSSSANSSSPSAQQLPGHTQLWPNSQDAGDGSGSGLEAGVIDSIIASVIKIQGNINKNLSDDTPTNAPDVDGDTAKFKSPLLIQPNGTSVLQAQDANSSNDSEISTAVPYVQSENNSESLLRAETTDMSTSSSELPTVLETQNTRDNTTSTTTAVPRVAAPPDPPFAPPVRTDLIVLAQAVSQVDSASSSSSSVQPEEQLSQFDYVVKAVQNPSRMTAAILDVANTVGMVGGIMSLPFLLPLLIGKRRRRRDAEGVLGISGVVVDRDLTLAAMKANVRI